MHRGHLTLAAEILSLCKLDGILFVPADKTPHREIHRGASYSQRCHLLKLALADQPNFLLDRVEREADLSGYTLDTVRELKKRYPETVFKFIIGTDNLAGFKTWHQWKKVLEEVRFLVGCRPGSETPDLSDFPEGRVDLVETSRVDISSTQIRDAIRRNVPVEELSQMVSPALAEYIVKERLYQ